MTAIKIIRLSIQSFITIILLKNICALRTRFISKNIDLYNI